jgi:acyl-CoA synthetase (AMP-forming)/AMP-acid ligase II
LLSYFILLSPEGSYLGTLYCGGTGYYLSPISFLKDPNVWLRAISRYKGTHTQAPNFAYALATRKFKDACSMGTFGQLKDFNLQSVQHMINAAEPVDQIAIAGFYETFRPYGLRNGVVVPTYGLAEHTVFVCSGGCNVLSLKKSSFENAAIEITDITPLDQSSASAAVSTNSDVQTIVGCGFPDRGEGVKLLIVNPETHDARPDHKVCDRNSLYYFAD